MKKELVCEQRDGFWFDSIFCFHGASLKKDALFIDDSETDRYIKYINENQCTKVVISLYNSNVKSFDFLHSAKSIEYLAIIGDARDIDCSPIYALDKLRYLIFQHHAELDMDKIKGIEFFSTNNFPNVKNIQNATSLRTLSVGSSFEKTKLQDLSFLSALQSLDVLLLTEIDLFSLKGIDRFSKLKVLDLDRLHRLCDITDLRYLKSSLTSLRIFDCNQIQCLDSIAHLQSLRFLSLDSQKKIENLDFISPLPTLKTFISSNSKIVDGNMTNVEGIDTVVIFPLRKTYYVISGNKKLKFQQREYIPMDRDLGEEEVEQWRRISY